MSIREISGLLVLLLIAGSIVFVLHRSDEQDRSGAAPLRDQSLAPKTLRSPNRLPEQPLDVPGKKSQEEASFLRPSSSLLQEPVSGEKPAEQESLITVVDGRLSVQVQNRSLQWVLEQIAQQSGVFISAKYIGGERISVQLQDLPLDQGLQHLLRDQDAFFFYGAEAGGYGDASLKAVWVYAKGKGRRILPVPAEEWASTRELAQGLTDPDPDERVRAIEGLIERTGKHALDTVAQSLRDPDEKVRYRVLHKALAAGLALSTDSLQELARYDSSPVVRFLALNALAEKPGVDRQNVRAIAELALNDPSQPIQEQAQEILDQLETASRPPDPSQVLREQEKPEAE